MTHLLTDNKNTIRGRLDVAGNPVGYSVDVTRYVYGWNVFLKIKVAGRVVHDSPANAEERAFWQALEDQIAKHKDEEHLAASKAIQPAVNHLFRKQP